MNYLFVINRIMNIKNIISNPYVSKKKFLCNEKYYTVNIDKWNEDENLVNITINVRSEDNINCKSKTLLFLFFYEINISIMI